VSDPEWTWIIASSGLTVEARHADALDFLSQVILRSCSLICATHRSKSNSPGANGISDERVAFIITLYSSRIRVLA